MTSTSEMRRLSTTGIVFNLSLGGVRTDPIGFSVAVGRDGAWLLQVEIINSQQLYDSECELAEHHSLNNKQRLGYNPYLPARTAQISVQYPDVATSEDAYKLQEAASQFFYRDFAAFLSFVQRRRVLIFNLRLIPSIGTISMPPFMAAEHMDAVAFGPPLAGEDGLASMAAAYADWHATTPCDNLVTVHGALARLTALLNLPYAYERAEGYWRTLEALGRGLPDTLESAAAYDAAKAIIGMKRESSSLKNMVRAGIVALPTLDYQKVARAHRFRNDITHEFLREPLESQQEAPAVMPFLQELCERFIIGRIGIDDGDYRSPAHNVIFGRVL